ncbi:hypothetical protein K7432_010202 [Basidiobolus ranarum]|uniref:Uncharacterized protein n=1 Tax=Basidiobolus ranarum TaxID=34480 RepID=A0ABR2VVV8_9FUNG
MNSLRSSIRTSTLNRVLHSRISPVAGSVLRFRQYSHSPRLTSDESDHHVVELAHHDFLSSVLKTSSDDDWASPAILNHSESTTNRVINVATSNEQLWDDLIQES